MVHSREGFDATMKVLKEFSDLKIYFHCRGYGPEEVEQVNELLPQVWFGFTNILTYPNAGKTRDSLLAMKPEQIVLETDAPFLPPQMFRGQVNTPAYVAYVYEKVAELLEMQQEELGALVEKNVRVFFGI
jgi:TatD DNase family protein